MLVYQRVTVQLPPFSSGLFFTQRKMCVHCVHPWWFPSSCADSLQVRKIQKSPGHQGVPNVTPGIPDIFGHAPFHLQGRSHHCGIFHDTPGVLLSTPNSLCLKSWLILRAYPKDKVYTKGGFSLLVPIFTDQSSIPWGKLTSALPDSQLQETPHQDPGWWPSPTSSAGLWWPGFNQ